MNEQEAKSVLLVRAIEQNDPGGEVLPHADRLQASREAEPQQPAFETAGAGMQMLSDTEQRFVIGRAQRLRARLEKDYPVAETVCRAVQWPSWIAWLLLAGAFVLGLLTNELGPEGRVNIIAFPLLGMLIWNIGVYLALLAVAVFGRRRERALPNGLARLLFWVIRPLRALPKEADAQKSARLAQGLRQFVRDWLHQGAPLHTARARRVLHLAAAALAIGAMTGMYVRGLGFEYLAGWESTFLDAQAVHYLLQIVLGLASLVTGIPIPDPERLATMRWPAGQGVNAARWIHLYAVTAAIVIVIPRLILAGNAAIKTLRLRGDFPLSGADEPYFRRLLSTKRGSGETARVVPYGFQPAARIKDALLSFLGEWLGMQTRVEFCDTIGYGEEDGYLRALAQDESTGPGTLILLFNMASTPEEESHGHLIQGLKGPVGQGKTAEHLLIIVDESSYRRRLGGQGGFDARLEERRKSWERLMRTHGVEMTALDLSRPDPDRWLDELSPAIRQHA